ncbi:AEC family transporter, partial [Pseudomonas aeruginosa]|uniref:AEC family transporter n=1 Tax=Pseudomonas aeruginosa TaxID=287 RepID=UPI002238FD80
LTTPLAMLLMGATLAAMNVKEIFNDWRVYPYAVIKQLGLPLLMWPLLKWVIKDPFILGITFLLAAMPVANMSVLFATEYHRDEKLAAKNVFITTLLSIITVPMVIYICM